MPPLSGRYELSPLDLCPNCPICPLCDSATLRLSDSPTLCRSVAPAFCLSVSLCLSACLAVFQPLCIAVSLSRCLFVSPPIASLSRCRSVALSLCFSFFLGVLFSLFLARSVSPRISLATHILHACLVLAILRPPLHTHPIRRTDCHLSGVAASRAAGHALPGPTVQHCSFGEGGGGGDKSALFITRRVAVYHQQVVGSAIHRELIGTGNEAVAKATAAVGRGASMVVFIPGTLSNLSASRIPFSLS